MDTTQPEQTNQNGGSRSDAVSGSAAGDERHWGLWQRVSLSDYRKADGSGKCVMRLNDPTNYNAWIYLVHVPLTWDGSPPHEKTQNSGSQSAGAHGSAHLVDCNAYGKEPLEYKTISEALADNRIVSVTKEEDGRFRVEEMCDEYFSGSLTREQLIAWADELRALAGDAPNHRI